MIIIIYAHPKGGRFSPFILKEVKNILSEKRKDYKVVDLYSIGYDPVLKDGELYTAGKDEVSRENKEFQEMIKGAEGIVFIYPVWWGGMPAILKGFMDRVFTPGFAFKYRRDKLIKSIPDKLLSGKRMVCLITSGGPRMFYTLILNPVKMMNRFVIFGFFGAKSKTVQIYNARKLDLKREEEVSRKTGRAIKWLL